jgi:hypothetical protein
MTRSGRAGSETCAAVHVVPRVVRGRATSVATNSLIRAGKMRRLDLLALRRGHVGTRRCRRAAHSKADATDDQRDEKQPSANPRCDEHRSQPYRYEEAGEEKRRAHDAANAHDSLSQTSRLQRHEGYVDPRSRPARMKALAGFVRLIP